MVRKVQCAMCHTEDSVAFYRQVKDKNFLCNSCNWFVFEKKTSNLYEANKEKCDIAPASLGASEEAANNNPTLPPAQLAGPAVPLPAKTTGSRQSARVAAASVVHQQAPSIAQTTTGSAKTALAGPAIGVAVTRRNAGIPKGKGRRAVFKAAGGRVRPSRILHAEAGLVTVSYCLSRGHIWHVGDIVSLRDADSGEIYYAQMTGIIKQPDFGHAATITWLLPISGFDVDDLRRHFDPEAFVLGPVEEYPRPLEQMEFICHAPKDYYKPKIGPFAQHGTLQDSILTTLRPVRTAEDRKSVREVFGIANENVHANAEEKELSVQAPVDTAVAMES